jgi:hypothetical protein
MKQNILRHDCMHFSSNQKLTRIDVISFPILKLILWARLYMANSHIKINNKLS